MRHKVVRYALVACAYACVWRRKATRVPETVESILVVQMAKLGDMVCTTPVFRAIKAQYPRAHVTVLGNRTNRALLEGNTDIDEYLVFDGVGSTYKTLRTRRFGAALLAGAPDLTSLVITYVAGVPLVVAPRIEGGRSPLYDAAYRLAARLVRTVPHRMGHYVPREYLRLLEPLHIHTGDTLKHLAYSNGAGKLADTLYREYSHPVIGIAPGSGDAVKQWPPERFAALADSLVERYGATVLLFGAGPDGEAVQELLAHIEHPNAVRNLFGALSLDELKATIARLDLFVSADTGPVYIAEAFGVATVDIVGPVDEREQAPRGPGHERVTPAYERVPQMHVMNTNDYDLDELRRQIDSITVEQVLRACGSALAQTPS